MKNLKAVLFLIFYSLSSYASEEQSCSASHAFNQQNLAEQIIQCELELNQNISSDIKTIRQSIYLANLYRKAGDTNKSSHLLETIYNQAKRLGSKALYEVTFAQGVNSYYSRDFIGSLEYFKFAYQYANELQDIKALANVYNALANVAQVFADYQSMSYLLEKSLSIYKDINDVEGSIKVFNNLGNAYRFNNDDNKALIMYRQALLNQAQQDNRLNAAHTRINMARSLIKLEQQHKAIELLKISLQDFSEIGAVHRMIETNGLIARAYLNLGNLESTEQYLQDNRELKLQIDANHFDPGSELILADFYSATGKLNLAKQILIEGVNKSRLQKNIEQLKKYLSTLATLLAEMEQTKLSSQYWQEHSDVLAEQLKQKKHYFGKLNFIVKSEHLIMTDNKKFDYQVLNLISHQFFWITILIFIGIIIFLLYKRKNNNLEIIKHKNESLEVPFIETDSLTKQNFNAKQSTTQPVIIDTRQRLVELMMLATQLWEQETQLGRIELAEKSKIWKVTIDDGRLRVRAMERYLSIEKLPTKPRWRNVIRTCHYVLGKCNKTSSVREELTTKLAEYLNIVKQQASH